MKNNIVIVLVETIDSANIGAVARGMLNFGFENLRLVNASDHKAKRAYDLACNASDVLGKAKSFSNLNDAISDCTYVIGFTRRTGSQRIPKYWDTLVKPVYLRSKNHEKIALVFGREDKGLSGEDTDLCNELSILETSKKCPSINLAQAVTLALYELSKQKSTKRPLPKGYMANAKQIKKNLSEIESTLIKIGYDDKLLRLNIMERIKDVFSRAGLKSADSKMIEGLIGQFKKYISRK